MSLAYAKVVILLAIFTLAPKQGVSELPYDVLGTILELSSEHDYFKDLMKVNVSDEHGPYRGIYRLDLDPDYVAYYEIDTGKDYVILSAGPQTKDFRTVQSGPDPRPTDLLIQQAQKNGQQCEKFYRLSPLGLMICKNFEGTVVAATYNWTAQIAEIDNWRLLDQLVKTGLHEFQGLWRKRAKDRRTILDWGTTDTNKVRPKKGPEAEALSPGSVAKVAIDEKFQSVYMYITTKRGLDTKSRIKFHKRLCKVLIGVCLEGTFKVNPLAVKKTPNNLFYLKLKVHENFTFVRKMLEGRELGFDIRIRIKPHQVIIKHYAINLQSKLARQYVPFGVIAVPGADTEFPDYHQMICCSGCYSGCAPVAWAQVFGYFDRRATPFLPAYDRRFSASIYGENGDDNVRAPKSLTAAVETFVEEIRQQVKTVCGSDGVTGFTFSSNNQLILPWFRNRQSHANMVTRWEGSADELKNVAKTWLDFGYPVVVEFLLNGPGTGHAVVATKYRTRSNRVRNCNLINCVWVTVQDYEFYLHYGWGGNNNQWQTVEPFGVHIVYLSS